MGISLNDDNNCQSSGTIGGKLGCAISFLTVAPKAEVAGGRTLCNPQDVGVLTILVFVAAFLTAIIVHAEMQRRFLAGGQGLVRSMAKSGALGFLSAIGIIATYMTIGNLFWRLFG